MWNGSEKLIFSFINYGIIIYFCLRPFYGLPLKQAVWTIHLLYVRRILNSNKFWILYWKYILKRVIVALNITCQYKYVYVDSNTYTILKFSYIYSILLFLEQICLATRAEFLTKICSDIYFKFHLNLK